MEHSNLLKLNPVVLLSVINTKLRDYYSSLELLCDDLNIDKVSLEAIFSKINYFYNEKENQFK